MARSKQHHLDFDSFWNPAVRLADALQFTLPSLERDSAAAGLNGSTLLAALAPARRQRIDFLLAEFDRLRDHPLLKDYLFDGLHLYLRITPIDRTFSTAFNRLEPQAIFFHRKLLRTFDEHELLDRPLPKVRAMPRSRRDAIILAARNALTLNRRETDPATHLDPASLRFYELERGVSVAIYGMVPRRQLPLESYVGYTQFKNGYPVAYGGGWVFGRRALFGINIFEPFRGGESGFLFCQMLRVYRQAFGVDYFEVEPYQYGKGNVEGITSGAFWFYYRFGFRPLDATLSALAKAEHARIATRKGYRTPSSTLRRLADGNIALQLGSRVPPSVHDIREHVTARIQTRYRSNRLLAEAECRRDFTAKVGRIGRLNADERSVLTEVSLWAKAADIRAARSLALLKRMIRVKPVTLYGYQELLLKLLR